MNKHNSIKEGRWKTYEDYLEERKEKTNKSLNRKLISFAVAFFILTVCSLVIWLLFA